MFLSPKHKHHQDNQSPHQNVSSFSIISTHIIHLILCKLNISLQEDPLPSSKKNKYYRFKYVFFPLHRSRFFIANFQQKMKKDELEGLSTGHSSTSYEQSLLPHISLIFQEKEDHEVAFECHGNGHIDPQEIQFINQDQLDLLDQLDQGGWPRDQTSSLHFSEPEQWEMNSLVSAGLNEDISSNDQLSAEKLSSGQLSAQWKRILQPQSNFYHKFKKNVNMPKAIGRYLVDHHESFEASIFANEPLDFDRLRQRLKFLRQWVKQSKKNSFKLQHLNKFFSEGADSRKQSAMNRLMMVKILQRCLRKEIIPNNQVKDKLEYLAATKVYGLRCTSNKLSKRMQMR